MNSIPSSLSLVSEALAAILSWPTNLGIEFRQVCLRTEPRTDLLVVFVAGLADSELVRTLAIEPLERAALDCPALGRLGPDDMGGLLAVPRLDTVSDLDRAVCGVMAGDAALFFDGAAAAVLVHNRTPLAHPAGSAVIQYPFKDRFESDLTNNIALIRKRLRDPRLIAEARHLPGERASDSALVYVKGRASTHVIGAVRDWMDHGAGEEAMRRGFQAGLAARFGMVPRFLSSSWPDKVATLLDLGYVAVLVDRLQYVAVAPVTAPAVLYSPGDDLLRRPVAGMLRSLRLILALIVVTGAAGVVALTNYHQEMIPTPFLMGLASVRENAPLPIIGEVLVLELVNEVIRATSARLPAPVSSGAALVAFILAAALAVFGGIVAPFPAIVSVMTMGAGLGLPDEVDHMVRDWRWPMIAGATIFGLFGIATVSFLAGTYLTQHESFGIPFLGETGLQFTTPGQTSSKQKRRGEERLFGSWSLAAAGAAISLVQGFYPIMVAAIRVGDTAAWLAVLFGGLFALALFTPAALVLQSIDRGNLISLAKAAAGWPGAIAVGLLVPGLLLFHSSLVIRQTSEMAVGAVYTHTPQTFATTALVLCMLYAAFGRLPGLVRSARAFLPVLLLSSLLALIGSAAWGKLSFLLPFWGPGVLPLLAGSLSLAALNVPAVLFMLVGAGHVQDRQHIWRAGATAIGGTTLLFVLLKVILLMAYPLPMGYTITYPLHELARLVTGGRFFERLEGIWVLVWAAGTALHLGLLLNIAADAYATAFGVATHRTVVPPLVAVAFTLAFFPPDQGQAIAWDHQAFPVYVGIGLLLPTALSLLAYWRRQATHEA